MKIIMIKNNKGGVGKTTVSVNLCALLAQKGNRVLIVDSDERANTTRMFLKDKKMTGTLGEVLLDKKLIQDTIVKTIYTNIDVLPATNELGIDMKELEQKSFLMDYENLKNKLELVENRYDYCIIDCSQKIDLLALNTLFASDLVIIPTKAEDNSLVGVLEMMEVIKQVNQKRHQPLFAKAFVADKERNKSCDIMVERMKLLLGEGAVLNTMIRHQAAVVNESVDTEILTPFVYLTKHQNSGIVADMIQFTDEVQSLLQEVK